MVSNDKYRVSNNKKWRMMHTQMDLITPPRKGDVAAKASNGRKRRATHTKTDLITPPRNGDVAAKAFACGGPVVQGGQIKKVNPHPQP